MTKSIYITTAEPHCGKSLVSLGITELLLRKTPYIGVFRPVINGQSPAEKDKNIDLLLSYFKLNLNYEDTYAFTKREVTELTEQGRYDDIMDRIIHKYKSLEEQCDFILCIGSDFLGEGAAFEFDFNANVAKNLGCPVLIVGHANGRPIEIVITTVRTTINSFLTKECQILGTIINRADPDQVADLLVALDKEFPETDQFFSVIPSHNILRSPTVREIAHHLQADVLYGDNQLDRLAYGYHIAAMQLQNYLPRLTDSAVVIVPGDRADVILSTLQAHQSHNYPQISAMILTNDLRPAPSIKQLLDGLPHVVPILAVETGTYTTSTNISTIRSYILPSNSAKINLSLKLFEAYVDTKTLEAHISSVETHGMSPKMFIYNLIQQAASKKQHIVLPEGYDKRMLKAAEMLLDRDIVKLTILGLPNKVKSSIQKLGLHIDLNRIEIINPEASDKFEDYTKTLFELRKHKGLTFEHAKDLMRDVSYFGTMMVYKGHADGMVSGAAHTTQHTIRPALQFIKTIPGISIVSSVFFMCLDDRVVVYGDCAVNPNPTSEELAQIAIASAHTSRAFGIEPKVAMLSYSSGSSGKGEDVERVREATRIAKERYPELKIEGPIQYDAAVDPEVGKSKLPDSEVAGQATVLVFPDLNTGNNTYKAVQRETGAIAVGPILQGLNKPVNDLSRGCTVEDIVNTVVITAIQAQGN